MNFAMLMPTFCIETTSNELSWEGTSRALPSEGRGHKLEFCRARNYSTSCRAAETEQNFAYP